MEGARSNEQTYLAWSIFNTFCCCFPLGIAAIVYSCRVSQFLLRNTKKCYLFRLSFLFCNSYYSNCRQTVLIHLEMQQKRATPPGQPRTWILLQWWSGSFASLLLLCPMWLKSKYDRSNVIVWLWWDIFLHSNSFEHLLLIKDDEAQLCSDIRHAILATRCFV